MHGRTSTNPIQFWLDDAGIGWRVPRAELAARYGISKANPYRWNRVAFDLAPPPLDHLLMPLGYEEAGVEPLHLPPVRFTAQLYVGKNCAANIHNAAAQFAAILGAAPVRRQFNTLKAVWVHGLSEISLTVWPPGLQAGGPLKNEAHEREPRLKTACSVEILSGWRVPLSPYEKYWMSHATPIARVYHGPIDAVPGAYPHDMTGIARHMTGGALEFIRIAPPDLAIPAGHFGVSDDGAVLIVNHHLLQIVPVTQVAEIAVVRLLPAKGGGGSWLELRCRAHDGERSGKTVLLAQGQKPDDLTALAEQLAYKIGKPLNIHPCHYDA